MTAPEHTDFSAFTDKEWEKLLADSFLGDVPDGISLPGFPPREVIEQTNGRFDRSVMGQAARFYQLVKALAAKHGPALQRETKLLDFGCGWGRILRYFLKEVSPENLFGSDLSSSKIGHCREQMAGFGQFTVNSKLPPLGFPDNTFDIIYAQSVFSHLSKKYADAWAEELARVLRPSGLICLTTLKKDDVISPESAASEDMSAYRRSLIEAFSREPEQTENYRERGIAFVPTSQTYTDWGHAALSEQYANDNWSSFGLEQVEWIENDYPQAITVLRGKS